MAAELSARILLDLEPLEAGQTLQSSKYSDVAPEILRAALQSLGGADYITIDKRDSEHWKLTEEGQEVAASGSSEARVFNAVLAAVGGLRILELPTAVGKEVAQRGQNAAMKSRWIRINGDRLVSSVDTITDTVQTHILAIQASPDPNIEARVLQDLKKRKLITNYKSISYIIGKGSNYAPTMVKDATDLLPEMLATGSWKNLKFKPYNFNALGAPQEGGALHPLMKVRAELRQIFFDLGFTEMDTSSFVETGFWNFDTLYVPQQHPARDMQDTFYISDPVEGGYPTDEETGKPLTEYFENIRAVHEQGKFGSAGYRYNWDEKEAGKLVLRTHTTSVSTAMLYKLAQNPGPAKYFSIDRVFRNETVDATHLAEFHQVEGVIAEEGLTLGGLIAFMEVFFGKMGINGLRFKPAYNPYTEPSMEIFGFHAGLKKWVEIGNSGMFRPEMLESMGLSPTMRVYGWGLSLERPTMIKYGIKNIRELLGHKVNIGFIKTNGAVLFDDIDPPPDNWQNKFWNNIKKSQAPSPLEKQPEPLEPAQEPPQSPKTSKSRRSSQIPYGGHSRKTSMAAATAANEPAPEGFVKKVL